MYYLVSNDNTFNLHVLISPLRGIDGSSRPSLGFWRGSGRGGDGVHRLSGKWTPGAFPIVLMHQLGSARRSGMGSVMDTFISPPVAPPEC